MSARGARAEAFDAACALVDTALAGSFRQDIVAELSACPDLATALERLRRGMQTHAWKARAQSVSLERIVSQYDRRTRDEGFHALHDWDGVSDAVNSDTIPVDVLNYLIAQRGAGAADPAVLAMLLDYYFLHVLGLLSLRVWDEGTPDAALDRLADLLRALQGPAGSGQQFAACAETLILIATSHYELHEHGYDLLLTRVRTLGPAHRARIAIAHASSIGCHLRFGFEATYGRDRSLMRNDNVADYPWLSFALATLVEEYDRLHDAGAQGAGQDAVVEALLNGLSPDPAAFLGDPPASLAACEAECAAFGRLFRRHRSDLLAAFERLRPSDDAYSPLSFFFNFSHNVLKGTVIDALLWAEPWRIPFDALLTGLPEAGAPAAVRQKLAVTLMGYARANPHKIRGRLMPVIVYDPQVGRRAFAAAMRDIREQAGTP